MKVEPKAKSEELDLHEEVWVLPAPRGGANCVNPQLASMPNTTELDLAPGLPYWRFWTFSWVENLFHMLVEALPRGCSPARRSTCVLNCQGVIMPWRGSELLHLCLSKVYYQTKYSRVRGHRLQIHAAFRLIVLQGLTCWLSITIWMFSHTDRRKSCGYLFIYVFIWWKKQSNVKRITCCGPDSVKMCFSEGLLLSHTIRTKEQ